MSRFKEVGQARYHDRHPFHERMNAGTLSRADVKLWAVNRYYYQRSIPLKDAAILSNCPLRDVRRRERIYRRSLACADAIAAALTVFLAMDATFVDVIARCTALSRTVRSLRIFTCSTSMNTSA